MKQIVRKIAYIGEVKYIPEILGDYDSDVLRTGWWESWDFLSYSMYYQGRRDDYSTRVMDAANEVLKPIISDGLKGIELTQVEKKLRMVIGSGRDRVGKGGDVKMVLSVLEYCLQEPEKPFVQITLDRLETVGVKSHYKELKQIYQFGDKVVSLYLTKVIELFNLRENIPEEDLLLIFPIDSRVRNTAKIIGLIDGDESTKIMRGKIVDACKNAGADHIHFNQGAWYISKHAPELVVDMLDLVRERTLKEWLGGQ